jgi:hypothetical protein
MPRSIHNKIKYRGRTKAYLRFYESLWRTSDLLDASVHGLTEKQKSLDDILSKFDTLNPIRGPVPKDHKPTISTLKLKSGGIKMTIDVRTANHLKKILELGSSKHQTLRFHLYSIIAVSIWGAFETYVTMLLEELYQKRPELLKSSEPVTQAEVIENRENIISFIAERQLDKVGHFTLVDTIEYFQKRLGITVASTMKERLQEFYLVRNVIAHNTGLPRPKLLKRLPKELSISKGELRVTKEYLKGMVNSIRASVVKIERQIDAKFF